MKQRVVIINHTFLKPTEIWIKRHIEGLKNYYPFVIVQNKSKLSQKLSSGRLISLDNLWFVRPLNYAVRRLFNTPYFGYEICLKFFLIMFRINIVHIHFFFNAVWFFDYVKKLNLPVIVTAHGSDVNRAFADPEYHEKLIHIFAKVDKIICVSQFIKNKLIELGCPKEKLIINYLGVPIVTLSRNDRNEINQTIRLICVAAFRPEKGHEMLLDVFSAVLKENHNCELYLVGDGDLKKILEHQAQKLSISEKVHFKGWKDQKSVFQLLSDSDIYVQCSNRYFVDGKKCREEGMPISPLEATMIGLPLVLTDVGGVSEVCEDNYNGFLCPYGNVKYMKDKIVTLINNKSIRSEFSKNGKNLVRNKFDQEHNLSVLENIYKNQIEEKLKSLKNDATN